MSWRIEFNKASRKQFKDLGKGVQAEICRYLEERIASDNDPRRFGKPLSSNFAGLWRYRVGDYRLICEIQTGTFIVLVLKIGHRKDVYR